MKGVEDLSILFVGMHGHRISLVVKEVIYVYGCTVLVLSMVVIRSGTTWPYSGE